MTVVSINAVAIAVIALIVGGALFYIIRAKKKGKKCIGCPYADSCASRSCLSPKGDKSAQINENSKNA